MKKRCRLFSGVARVFCALSQRQLGLAVFGWVLATASSTSGQGMPPEVRANIHALFNSHDQVQRELKLTEEGYEATTESTNRQMVAVLQDHVRQMQERLDSGLAARRWDPAFAEYRAFYDEIDFKVKTTESGVKVTAIGRTPEGVKVAQNHATVIDEFVNDGWKAHDRTHPAVLGSAGDDASAGESCGRGRQSRGQGSAGCVENCQRGCGGRCSGRSTSD